MPGRVRNQQLADLEPATLAGVLRIVVFGSALGIHSLKTLNLTRFDRPQGIDHFEDRLVVHLLNMLMVER